MTVPLSQPEREPLVLVVDDDRRVRELLEVAFSAHGYRVATAADGDEAVRRAATEHPDLIVLDVRLPRRSGLDVCESLRADLADPLVPIILVSAASESETRLQAFQRGADDYVVKPFSPRELLARVKRLLVRHRALREARAQLATAQHDAARNAEDSRRAQSEADAARGLSELAIRTGGDFHRTRDLEAIGHALLAAAQRAFHVPALALFVRDGRTLWPCAVRGDGFARVAAIHLDYEGGLAGTLAALGHPVHRHQLERLPEHAADLRAFAAAGFDLLAPLRTDAGLEALVAFDERRHGAPPTRAELEALESLCGLAAPAVAHAVLALQRAVQAAERAIERSPARDASAELCERAARHLGFSRRDRIAIGLAVRAGERPPAADLATAAMLDPSGFIPDLLARIDEVRTAPALAAIGGPPAPADPERARARELVAAGWRLAAEQEAGTPFDRALFQARIESATLAHALRRAHAEEIERAPEERRVTVDRAAAE